MGRGEPVRKARSRYKSGPSFPDILELLELAFNHSGLWRQCRLSTRCGHWRVAAQARNLNSLADLRGILKDKLLRSISYLGSEGTAGHDAIDRLCLGVF